MADKLVPITDVVHVEMSPVGMPEKRRQEMSLDAFQAIEDELFTESASAVRAMLAFQEIDPASEEPPEQWIADLGYPKAMQKYRVAKAAWMCQSEAPVGLKFASATYIGIARVRAGDNQRGKGVNVSTVVLVQAPQQYPVKELEGE